MGADYSVENPYARKYCSPATIKCAEPVSGNVVIPCGSCQPRCDKSVYEWRKLSKCQVPSQVYTANLQYLENAAPPLPFQSVGQGVDPSASVPGTIAGCKKLSPSAVARAIECTSGKLTCKNCKEASGVSFERLFRENEG